MRAAVGGEGGRGPGALFFSVDIEITGEEIVAPIVLLTQSRSPPAEGVEELEPYFFSSYVEWLNAPIVPSSQSRSSPALGG
jgi:hypothetical protein